MARDITLLRYRFDERLWKFYVTGANRTRIGRFFQATNRIYGEDGRRFGFVNCSFYDGTVVGYYAQEGTKEIIDYGDNNQPVARTEGSFAHIIFAIHLETGLVGLQSTSITGFVDLSIGDMRTQFPVAVEELLQELNIEILSIGRLSKTSVEITSSQLYQVFSNFKTTALEVHNLTGRTVPTYEEFKIFNPRYDEDIIFRQVFGEDIQNGLDNISLSSAGDQDIRDSATAKLSARVGDIKTVTVDPANNGSKVKLTTSNSDKLKENITSDSHTSSISREDAEKVSNALTLGQVTRSVNRLLQSIISSSNGHDDIESVSDE